MNRKFVGGYAAYVHGLIANLVALGWEIESCGGCGGEEDDPATIWVVMARAA